MRIGATGWAALICWPGDRRPWLWMFGGVHQTRRELIERWEEGSTGQWRRDRRKGHIRAVRVCITAEVRDDNAT